MTHLPNHKVTITNEEINELPLGAFEGKVSVITEPGKLEKAIADISKHAMVGFDTETKPVFVSGHSNKVSLLQIALPEKVYLIRLNQTGLTKPIIHFLKTE